MGYVVVVFAIINSAALVAVAWYVSQLWRELPNFVATAIGDEVRKQDDRIEKRLERRERPAEDVPETAHDGVMRIGQPYRRR